MNALRRRALFLLLAALLAGCVCAPATAPLTSAPSDEEIAQARRAFGYSEAPGDASGDVAGSLTVSRP